MRLETGFVTNQGDVPDRIFSVPGALSYVLVKNGEVNLAVGNWARPLASTKLLVEGGICYDTRRHGSFIILDPRVTSWWNELELHELSMTYFEVHPRSIGEAGYTINRVSRLQLSGC